MIENAVEIRGLTKYFGGLAAVNNLDLDVNKSEILGLIGPNGAGKTTLFNLINGFFPPTSGETRFKGDVISSLKAHEIAKKGIGRTFQQSVLFMESAVLENVFTGFHLNYKSGLLSQFLHTREARKESNVVIEPAPAIRGNAIGTMAPLPPVSCLNSCIPIIISNPISRRMIEPAMAKEEISTPNSPSKGSPTNKKRSIIP